MRKKIIALVAAALLISSALVFTGCGDEDERQNNQTSSCGCAAG